MADCQELGERTARGGRKNAMWGWSELEAPGLVGCLFGYRFVVCIRCLQVCEEEQLQDGSRPVLSPARPQTGPHGCSPALGVCV